MSDLINDNAVEISILAGATIMGSIAMIVDTDMAQTVITGVIAVYTLVAGFYWGKSRCSDEV